MRSAFDRDVEYALKLIAKARTKGWRGFDGESLEPKLVHLELVLQRALKSGSTPVLAELQGLSRWVGDWIPDLDHPLVDAVHRVSQHVSETRRPP